MEHLKFLSWSKVLIGLVMVFSISTESSAQDFYYNTVHHGLHSTLMGGSVTAGNNDLSMGYYNPAAVHLVESRGGISLIRPSLSRFGFNNVLGQNRVSNDFDFGLTPSLATYKIDYRSKFQLLLITIQKSKWDTEYNIFGTIEEDQNERYGSLRYRYKGDDYWLGAASSYKISDRLHIGVSQFISTASYQYRSKILKKITDQSTGSLQRYFSDQFDARTSNSLSFVTKIGLQYQLPRHTLGIVVKTPNYLKLLKGGFFERESVSIMQDNSGVVNVQDFDVAANINTPWELNLGYAYHINEGHTLACNLSYNSKVSNYVVSDIALQDMEMQDWYSQARAVTNFSIGYEGKVNERLGWIGSFRTNFLAYENPHSPGQYLYLLEGDRFHIAFGANYRTEEHAITLGLDWGFTGTQTGSVLQGFPGVEDVEFQDARLVNHSLTLVFTYGFLIDRIKQGLEGEH